MWAWMLRDSFWDQVQAARTQRKPVPQEGTEYKQREAEKTRERWPCRIEGSVGEEQVSRFLWFLEAALISNGFPVSRAVWVGPGPASFPPLGFQKNLLSVPHMPLCMWANLHSFLFLVTKDSSLEPLCWQKLPNSGKRRWVMAKCG